METAEREMAFVRQLREASRSHSFLGGPAEKLETRHRETNRSDLSRSRSLPEEGFRLRNHWPPSDECRTSRCGGTYRRCAARRGTTRHSSLLFRNWYRRSAASSPQGPCRNSKPRNRER